MYKFISADEGKSFFVVFPALSSRECVLTLGAFLKALYISHRMLSHAVGCYLFFVVFGHQIIVEDGCFLPLLNSGKVVADY